MTGRFTSQPRHRGRLVVIVAALVALFALTPDGTRMVRAQSNAASAWTPLLVPKAECGPGERTESGLQGQTTSAERFSAKASQAYNCNLELVGQFEGEGAGMAMSAMDTCGYFSTTGAAGQKNPGVVVVDASDRRRPRPTMYLESPAMLRPNEALDANTPRKLLAAIEVTTTGGSTNTAAPTGNEAAAFDVYDISDCRKPVLKSSIRVPGFVAHAGRFAPDGRTFYATSATYTRAPSEADGFLAIDVSDPAKARVLYRWSARADIPPHGIAISEDGTRAFLGLAGGPGRVRQDNGIAILDTTDLQRRAPNPQVRVLGKLLWNDGGVGQVPIPLTIQGRRHLIFADWTSNRGADPEATRQACAQGLPPFGFVHLIDITDEQNPKTASKFVLQVNDPVNCSQLIDDPASRRAGYASIICEPDDARNAALLACAWKEVGLRVFDVRNPARPIEIAYYKPPGRRNDPRPGSGLLNAFGGADRTADWVIQVPRFDKARNEVWFMSHDNGMQIVRFTDRFRAARKELFGSR